MRLLAPNDSKDLKEQENIRQILRTQELEKAAKEARLKLADSQTDFNNTLAQNRQKWALEEDEHRKRVNERKVEIEALEARRLRALMPIEDLQREAETKLAEASLLIERTNEKESYTEELAEKLQDKLDEVGQWEQDVSRKTKELEMREIGITNQINSTNIGVKRLSEEMTEFLVYKEGAEKEIKDSNLALRNAQINLFNREQELAKLQKTLNEQTIRLQDERGVLDRAYKEVQRMKADIPLVKKTKTPHN